MVKNLKKNFKNAKIKIVPTRKRKENYFFVTRKLFLDSRANSSKARVVIPFLKESILLLNPNFDCESKTIFEARLEKGCNICSSVCYFINFHIQARIFSQVPDFWKL